MHSMPLLRKRRADHELFPLPEGMSPSDEVFVVRFTGEVFKDYECAAPLPKLLLARVPFLRNPGAQVVSARRRSAHPLNRHAG